MKKIIQNKKMGILMIAVLLSQMPLQAGWFSGFGDRLINGVVNTVQTNISRKANKTVDDVMDGNIKPSNKKQSTKQNQSEAQVQKATNSVDTSQEIGTKPSTKAEEKAAPISYKGATGMIIPSTGNYELIDLGITKFTGEEIYSNPLKMFEPKKDIDAYLEPGYYFISIIPGSRTEPMSVFYTRESEGKMFGHGIEIRKKLRGPKQIEMLLGRDEIQYIVEVLPNTKGHLELALINNQKLSGSGWISIFKIPSPTLK